MRQVLVTSEALTANDLQLNAATGLVLKGLAVDSLTGVNRGSGNIDLVQLAAGGDLLVNGLSQASSTETGFIRVVALGGDITFAGATTVAGSGEVRVTGSSSLVVNAAITTQAAPVTLLAATNITVNAPVSSNGGIITFTATNGFITQNANVTAGAAAITYTAGGAITMQDGVTTSGTAAIKA